MFLARKTFSTDYAYKAVSMQGLGEFTKICTNRLFYLSVLEDLKGTGKVPIGTLGVT